MKFDDFLNLTSLDRITQDGQINVIGNFFDSSFDNKSISGLEHCFELAKQINQADLTDENFTTLQYDFSNGWSYLRKLKYQDTQGDWNFQMIELTNEIYYLRKAISSNGFSKVRKERQCQIYTNLGNSFSYIGRFVESQTYWNKALEIIPSFSMAIANKANGLYYYAKSLFDDIHRNIFFLYSYDELKKAIQLKHFLDIGAAKYFQQFYDHLTSIIHPDYLDALPDLDNYDLGDDEQLKKYRQWGVNNQLFINPLNDLGSFTIASHDCLNLPTLIIEIKRPPVYLNLYNQIKQEYGTARFFYYNSVQGFEPHFSDIDIELVETMETARYSFYIEQLKVCFRLTYSILDKISYLLNDYLQLGIDAHKISFRTLWYTNLQKLALHPFFTNSDNWALRGLYWLSKDLYEKENDFDTVLEPEAKEIAIIRNYIEHKGFKIVSDYKVFLGIYDNESDISYTITRKDFEVKTLKLLKLTRAAIMYVSLAISHEEQKKDYTQFKALPITSSIVPTYMKT